MLKIVIILLLNLIDIVNIVMERDNFYVIFVIRFLKKQLN
jgi:hypothetical protein